MAANGISTLATKRARQIAKLELASTKRAADGNPRATYDLTQLPTVYAEGNNDTNDVVDNPNTGGLVIGRPWIEGTPTPEVVTRNLQLYLDAADTESYPGTGTIWTDLSTNEYATTLIDAPAFNTTHFTFDGVRDYVDTNQSLASESFSVGAWFRTTNTGINMMLSKETTTGRPWNYRLWLNGGELRGDIGQGLLTPEIVFDGEYNDGEWYFGMFTRDDNNWHLYVNGSEVATRTDPLTSTVSNSQELWICRSAYLDSGNSPTGSYPYNGDIGQVFVYDDVLTAAEVLQNYNATKSTYGL